ncbi:MULTISPECIES: phage tail protein [Vagococcus]|uniref:phage tail protein n=1 Tax=Vagococcus TaxID=2737 RepID=UPI000E52E977|nr:MULTISPECIES: phage tail protein [Vagococcus]RHH70094.1 hypothetical protein DW196_04835 [Vagococcus sp. AM17-17]
MYFVKLDGQTFYDPRIEEYEIFDSKLKLEVNKAGALDFTVYPTHPLFARIKKLKSIVEVYQDEVLLFRGRVLDDELEFDRAKTVICEGELAYLNDTVLRPYEFSGGVREYLELLVEQHNSQVPVEKQFRVGTVTVKDPNDYIVRSDKTYPQTWDVVESKLIKSLGGYLIVRRENGVNYLDYLEDSNEKSLQKIELGQNLLDLATRSSATELYTAILPLGKEAESEDGQKGARLTIESVNDGKDFIQDDEAVKKYGFLMKSVTWNDVTVATNLLNKAKQELAQLVKLSLTLDLTAIDLSLVDATIDEFRVFEYVQVVSVPHGVDELLLVEKQELHLTNPSQDKLSIGYQRRTLTENQIQTDKAISNIDVIEGPKGEPGEPGKDGEQGPPGIPGEKGADGKTQYTHIAYANSADGTKDFSLDNPERKYIGMYVDFTQKDSNTPSDYAWSLIKGADGTNGTPGKPGEDGKTPYFHTAWANGVNGEDFTTVYPNENLIITLKNKEYTGSREFVNSPDWNIAPIIDTHGLDAIFTYTFEIIGAKDGTFNFYCQNGSGTKYSIAGDIDRTSGLKLTTSWKKYVISTRHRLSNNSEKKALLAFYSNYGSGAIMRVRNMKMEIGNISSPGLDNKRPSMQYIGTYSDFTEKDSEDYTKYTWSAFKGRGITSITEEYAISDSKTDAPTMGWSVRVPEWEIGKYLWLRSKIVYSSPTETVYTEAICDTTWEAVKDLEEAVDEKLNDKADNDYVTEVVTTLETSIEKESDSIRTEVKETYTAKSELSEYQEEVSSEFEQTKNSFNFNFKNLVEQISTLDHDTQVKFQEIVKYIRFENGNIILGQVGNELILKLQNNKIQFLQSGAEVAYFTNNKLYVTDGEFINSLRLGSFAFIPRDNGSLDFKKVVN